MRIGITLGQGEWHPCPWPVAIRDSGRTDLPPHVSWVTRSKTLIQCVRFDSGVVVMIGSLMRVCSSSRKPRSQEELGGDARRGSEGDLLAHRRGSVSPAFILIVDLLSALTTWILGPLSFFQ